MRNRKASVAWAQCAAEARQEAGRVRGAGLYPAGHGCCGQGPGCRSNCEGKALEGFNKERHAPGFMGKRLLWPLEADLVKAKVRAREGEGNRCKDVTRARESSVRFKLRAH